MVKAEEQEEINTFAEVGVRGWEAAVRQARLALVAVVDADDPLSGERSEADPAWHAGQVFDQAVPGQPEAFKVTYSNDHGLWTVQLLNDEDRFQASVVTVTQTNLPHPGVSQWSSGRPETWPHFARPLREQFRRLTREHGALQDEQGLSPKERLDQHLQASPQAFTALFRTAHVTVHLNVTRT